MTTAEVKKLQRAMNRFTERFLVNLPPIIVDGDKDQTTNRRISKCKFYLGYEGNAVLSHRVTPAFLKRLSQPATAPAAMIELARERRHKQHERAHQKIAGVATFDGQPVARWLKPYLEFARENGWEGPLLSGYRTPEESEQVCINEVCGHPTCEGKCAGKTSKHSQKTKPGGALDVNERVRFAQLMERCPLQPRIFNDLPKDRNHFSATGH